MPKFFFFSIHQLCFSIMHHPSVYFIVHLYINLIHPFYLNLPPINPSIPFYLKHLIDDLPLPPTAAFPHTSTKST